MIRVLIWNEYRNEKEIPEVGAVYPEGIHKVLADFIKEDDIEVKTATLDDENCGITKELLEETDVMLWWGHFYHKDVPDEVAFMVRDAVLRGMGIIFLHSAHQSKPFQYLLGTNGNLCWRESDDEALIWVVEPTHPITQGIDRLIVLDKEETYGEPFVIPTPDKLLFLTNYSGGEVFRSGCLFERGNGKIFYFQPGHESLPTYYNPQIQRVIKNAVRFVAPERKYFTKCSHVRNIKDDEPYVIEKKKMQFGRMV